MPTILENQSLSDRIRDFKRGLVLPMAEATHNLAAVAKAVNERFWSLPTDFLLEVLNANIPETLAMFGQNTALGMACNASLDAVAHIPRDDGSPMFPARAPVVPGRTDIVFDPEQGRFVLVPPVEEPTEESP